MPKHTLDWLGQYDKVFKIFVTQENIRETVNGSEVPITVLVDNSLFEELRFC